MGFVEQSARARAMARTDYATPVELYAELDAMFHFTIDLAAHARNAKHRRFFSPEQDSLRQSWEGETGFLNPPYGRGVESWLAKARDSAIRERAIVVQLLPARVGSRWWRRFVMGDDEPAGRLRDSYWVPDTRVLWLRWEGLITGIHFHAQRIAFEGEEHGAKFDTAVVVQASPNRPPPLSAKSPVSLAHRWPR